MYKNHECMLSDHMQKTNGHSTIHSSTNKIVKFYIIRLHVRNDEQNEEMLAGSL